MKKEDQVVSLELAKELKGLNVKQDSIFWWVKHIKSGTNYRIWDLVFGKDENDLVNEYIPAYTVAELGEMLPDWVNFTQKNYNSISGRTWFRCGSEKVMMWCDGDTEADARAKMAIPLIKEGIIG